MLYIVRRRRRIEQTTKLLSSILEKLPQEDPRLLAQLNAGIIRSLVSTKGGMEFRHHPRIARQFESATSSTYSVEGIFVRDQLTYSLVPVELHVAFGLISGYLAKSRVFHPDTSVIDVSKARKRFKINPDFEFVKSKLTCCEWALLDPDEVYRVTVRGKEVVRLVGLDRGDFMAMDHDGSLLLFTGEPARWLKLNVNLADAILEFTAPVAAVATSANSARLLSPTR